jgi:hypothetical protein
MVCCTYRKAYKAVTKVERLWTKVKSGFGGKKSVFGVFGGFGGLVLK